MLRMAKKHAQDHTARRRRAGIVPQLWLTADRCFCSFWYLGKLQITFYVNGAHDDDIITVPLCYYSLLMPLSCDNIWLLCSSYSSLSPACHRSDWNATNSVLRLSGWAKLVKAEEMFVYLRASGCEVWKWKCPSFRAWEKCRSIWCSQSPAVCEWRQDEDTGCLRGSPDFSDARESELGGFWGVRGGGAVPFQHLIFFRGTC